MKNKLSKLLYLVLALTLFLSPVSKAFPLVENDESIISNESIIEDFNEDPNDEHEELREEKTEIIENEDLYSEEFEDDSSYEIVEDSKTDSIEENEKIINEFKKIIEESKEDENKNEDKLLENEQVKYSLINSNEEEISASTEVFDENESYLAFDIDLLNGKSISSIDLNLKNNSKLIKSYYKKDDLKRLGDILDNIDSLKNEEDNEENIKEQIDSLKTIKKEYNLSDQALKIVSDEKDLEDESTHYKLKALKDDIKGVRLLIKLGENNQEEKEDVGDFVISDGEKNYSISIKKLKDDEKIEEQAVFRSLGSFRSFDNRNNIISPQTIGKNDIAPENYLSIIENMPGAKAEVIEYGSALNEIVSLNKNTKTSEGDMWSGNWDKASKTIFNTMGGSSAIAICFKGSNPRVRHYHKDIDAGWNDNDLNMDYTSMWVKVKYTNAAYYNGEVVDAVAIIKVTPMKNRNENSYFDKNYGKHSYKPMLQISHNLYKGWCWQNVREINIDLTFIRKNQEVINLPKSEFGKDKAFYYTINSLNPIGEHTDGANHQLGPEFVRPKEGTYSGAYVIPESNIVTSYNGSSKGLQYAYNGGTNKWGGVKDDNPKSPNWSKNSVLFTSNGTSNLNFTMGNLMKDEVGGSVPRTNFVWTSMSTQSFTGYYVHYKDIEVEKKWSDGNSNHNPITVKLLKNYKVEVTYKDGYWNRTREIEVKDLLEKEINLSSDNNWRGGFFRIADEESQNKLIKKSYSNNNNKLIKDAGANFPNEIKDKDFKISKVYDFSYKISEVKVDGYKTHISKIENPEEKKDYYTINNTKNYTPPEPEPEPEPNPNDINPDLIINKRIDYLSDGVQNKDTKIQRDEKYKDILDDIYRLYLDVEGKRGKKEIPTDLIFVLDGSSSMIFNKDLNGLDGRSISRRDAMVDMLNNTDLIPSFLNQNEKNRVAFVKFSGDTRNRKTKKWQGYSYVKDSEVIEDWSHNFSSKINVDIPGYYFGTNYQAGLLRAEDLLNKSKNSGHKQVMIFISDGVPTFWIDENGNRCENGNYANKNTVNNSKRETKKFIDALVKRHPDLAIYAVGVSKDIYKENIGSSQSPEVLRYMAQKGKGSYIGVKEDTRELVSKLKNVIEKEVTNVVIEDELSDWVEILTGGEDFKVIQKKDGREIILWENNNPTSNNGWKNNKIIDSLTYDKKSRKVVLKINPNYKLEEGTKYILSYNIRVNQKAKDEFKINGYKDVGDEDTDYENNQTSSNKDGFKSNKKALAKFNNQEKEYKHPVVQVKDNPGKEFPQTGGEGVFLIKLGGLFVIVLVGFGLFKRKRKS